MSERSELEPEAAPDFLIVGTPRSGTTLVQRMASELAGVRVPPETHFFTEFAPGLAKRRTFPLRGADLVAELRTYSERGYLRGVSLEPDVVAERLGGTCRSMPALFAAIVRYLGDGAEILGEKTPGHLLWWRPLTAAFPHVRLVIVVRDPRGVVASYEQVGWGGDHVLNAQKWCFDSRQVRAAEAVLGPARCLTFRYEDVVADHNRARDQLGEFLGAGPGPAGEVSITADDLFPGWESWKGDVMGPVNPERAFEWRTALRPVDAARVAAIARRHMAHFGYDGAPSTATALAREAAISPVDQLKRIKREARRWRQQARIASTARGWAVAVEPSP